MLSGSSALLEHRALKITLDYVRSLEVGILRVEYVVWISSDQQNPLAWVLWTVLLEVIFSFVLAAKTLLVVFGGWGWRKLGYLFLTLFTCWLFFL